MDAEWETQPQLNELKSLIGLNGGGTFALADEGHPGKALNAGKGEVRELPRESAKIAESEGDCRWLAELLGGVF